MDENVESSAGAEETPAPAGRMLSEDRYPVEDPGPGKPKFEPSPGTRHVWDSSKQMWMVERDPSFREDSDSPEQQRAERPTPDVKPGTADESGGLQLAEHLPTIIREDPSAPTVLREASEALDHVRMEPAAKQRLVDLAADLHAADLEAGVPPLWNE